MADVKISALSALTGAQTATDDLYVVVDTNVQETKKQTRAELFQNVPAISIAGAFVFNDAGGNLNARFEGDTDTVLLCTNASTDRVGVGMSTPNCKLQVNGSFGLTAPIYITTDYVVAATANYIVSGRAASNTLTLPAVASSAGRILKVITWTAFPVVSATANVVKNGAAAATAILPGTIGAWAELSCDGTYWYIVASGTVT